MFLSLCCLALGIVRPAVMVAAYHHLPTTAPTGLRTVGDGCELGNVECLWTSFTNQSEGGQDARCALASFDNRTCTNREYVQTSRDNSSWWCLHGQVSYDGPRDYDRGICAPRCAPSTAYAQCRCVSREEARDGLEDRRSAREASVRVLLIAFAVVGSCALYLISTSTIADRRMESEWNEGPPKSTMQTKVRPTIEACCVSVAWVLFGLAMAIYFTRTLIDPESHYWLDCGACRRQVPVPTAAPTHGIDARMRPPGAKGECDAPVEETSEFSSKIWAVSTLGVMVLVPGCCICMKASGGFEDHETHACCCFPGWLQERVKEKRERKAEDRDFLRTEQASSVNGRFEKRAQTREKRRKKFLEQKKQQKEALAAGRQGNRRRRRRRGEASSQQRRRQRQKRRKGKGKGKGKQKRPVLRSPLRDVKKRMRLRNVGVPGRIAARVRTPHAAWFRRINRNKIGSLVPRRPDQRATPTAASGANPPPPIPSRSSTTSRAKGPKAAPSAAAAALQQQPQQQPPPIPPRRPAAGANREEPPPVPRRDQELPPTL